MAVNAESEMSVGEERFNTAMEIESTKPSEAVAIYRGLIDSGDLSGDEAVKLKEQAIYKLGELHSKLGQAQEVCALLKSIRPFFATIPKAKTAKIVRSLIDLVAQIGGTESLQMELCKESIEWCKSEKRSFLRQRIESRLAALYLDVKNYTEALLLLQQLLREVKRIDDKPLLVEIQLIESRTHLAVRNLAKAKASLTSARTAANAIYCPPSLQAQIDIIAGTLHAEEKDYKTAFSYFYEAFENFDSLGQADKAVKCLKYMLLCKIMCENAEEVTAIINGKAGIRHAGKELEAMKTIASSYQKRSLHDFQTALETYHEYLGADPLIKFHLSSLYGMLLAQNLCKLIEPFSCVEVDHVAKLIGLPTKQVQDKLSQMILDKKFAGILDQGAGQLIVYEEQTEDATYQACIDTLHNMNSVVDNLNKKANTLA